jgi:hypothetical protein
MIQHLFHCTRLHKYAAAFPHGDVVCGIKASGRDVAEGTNGFTVVCGSHCVAGVFDNEKVVFFYNRTATTPSMASIALSSERVSLGEVSSKVFRTFAKNLVANSI